MSILYIIATPIGNLNDISLRALDVLKKVDIVACEDTRHTKKLLSHFNIQKKVFSYHEHNEIEIAKRIIALCQSNQSVALLSDAGTPLISDPGYDLVKMAHEAKVKVVPLPGACAAITALSASGLSSDKFVFEGFLPAKSNARKNRLHELQEEMRTIIFYEAPHRVIEMIEDLSFVFGENREVTIARELTKTFETIRKGFLKDIVAWLKNDPNQTKGEFVVIVSGIDEKELRARKTVKAEMLLKTLLHHLPLKNAVQLTKEMTDASKNDLYAMALAYQKSIE